MVADVEADEAGRRQPNVNLYTSTPPSTSSAERTDSKFVVNPTRQTITVPPVGSERTSESLVAIQQLLKPPPNEWQNRAWRSISL